MDDPTLVHRLQFAFTITYHYLFPQLTMGLAFFILILKTQALRTGQQQYARAARFWIRILAIGFAFGVVTGIPMEFQFGTNWARFSEAAGGIIGQTLAMEGTFAFFLESTFLGLLLFGEKKLGPRGHWFSALAVFVGSWLSAYFIIATNAWMQHPVGYSVGANGEFVLESLGALLTNPWALWQYLHNQCGSLQTGAFVVASTGAFYLLIGRHTQQAQLYLRVAVIVGCVASILQIMPTGDMQGKMVAKHQPVTLAAMEGLFETEEGGAPLAILGQPDVENRKLDNPLVIPRLLSFLTYNRWDVEVKGLDAFPEEDWPDNIPLLYFSYHIMVGLGTMFVSLMGLAAFLLWRGRLFQARPVLWAIMLALPLPFVANTAGWITAETGRQPWLIYGLMRTSQGASLNVSSGNVWFSLLGFAGLYSLLSILFLFLMRRQIERGPESDSDPVTIEH